MVYNYFLLNLTEKMDYSIVYIYILHDLKEQFVTKNNLKDQMITKKLKVPQETFALMFINLSVCI